jgi:hypothetical protein
MSTVYGCPLSHKLISISGIDKLAYLHGQITQDINKLKQDNFLWTGHCNAKGKLWSAAKLFAFKDSYFLAASEPEIDQSLGELKKYAVFSKVDIEQSTLRLVGIIADDLTLIQEQLGLVFSAETTACDFSGGKALKLAKNRLMLVLNEGYQLPETITLLHDDSLWQQFAILAGEPQLNRDAIGEYVPQMVNLQAINGISFRKGCYTGQETVARMKYLGKNKRAMFIVSGHSNGTFDELDLETQVGENWRRAGKIIAQAYNKETQTFYGLVVLPNDSEPSQSLRVKHAPQVELTIQPLPYSLEDE